MPLGAQGEFALVREHFETALTRWVQPVKHGTIPHDHTIYVTLADTAAQQRDVEALQKYAPLAEALAVRDDHRLYRAIAHRAHGVLHRLKGDYAQAEARLASALELFGQLAARWQIGRTHAEIGEVARAQNEFEKARDHFTLAIAAFDEMGAKPESEKAQAILNELGP